MKDIQVWFYIFQFTVHCLEQILKRNYHFKCIEKYLSNFNSQAFVQSQSQRINTHSNLMKLKYLSFLSTIFNFQFTILCLEHISKKNYYFKYIEKSFDSTNYNSQVFVRTTFQMQRLYNHLNLMQVKVLILYISIHNSLFRAHFKEKLSTTIQIE